MLYLYDDAIADDLRDSFDTTSVICPFVKVIDVASGITLAAQLQDDDIKFPLICILRDPDYQINTDLNNFTRRMKGVANVFDSKTNTLYYERAIPINVKYTLSVIDTSTARIDELVRELIFKYTSMYFLTIQLPYESDRKLRFGVEIDSSDSISRTSGTIEYLSEGTLYSTNIPLNTLGINLLTYTPAKLRNQQYEIEAYSKDQFDKLQ